MIMMKYKAFSIKNISKIPQMSNLDPQIIKDIQVVGEIYPFKTNNYVVDNLIDWQNPIVDPIFNVAFVWFWFAIM